MTGSGTGTALAPALSILIVSWNTCNLLARCLACVYAHPPQGEFDTWVVDNASTDGSAAMVRERFPQVHLIVSPTNLGFAAGNNVALRRAAGRYLLLLNPDTEVRPGALDGLVHFLEECQRAGAAGARLLNPDGSLQSACRPAPTLWREACDLFWVDRLYPVSQYPVQRWDLTLPHQVDVLQGTCLLLRRRAIEEVGLFDEGYFMYSEEVDLCHRLRRHGWEVWWVPNAVVVHHGGQSTRQVRAEMLVQLYRGKVRFFRKHRGARAARGYKALLALAALARLPGYAARCLPGGSSAEPLEKARLYRRLLAELPAL